MRKIPAAVAVLLLGLTACGTSAADRAAQSAASAAAAGSTEVRSCAETLHFDKAPERVVVLSGTSVPILDALRVLDRVVARAGEKNFGPETELQKKFDAIKTLDSHEMATGGAVVSTEAVLSVQADLVIGFETGVDRSQLAEAGIPLYSPDAFCPDYAVTKADWSLVDAEIEKIAAIFGVTDRVPSVLTDLHRQISDIEAANGTATASAAALYVTPGSTAFYTYGTSSMVQPIFEANGLKNAYDDETTRVFDASMEDLLKRNPDWIVLLAADATDQEVLGTFTGFSGATDLKAVVAGHVVVLPFALTDPPSPLSVRGAAELAKRLGR